MVKPVRLVDYPFKVEFQCGVVNDEVADVNL